MEDKIIDFCTLLTKDYDKSHDVNHHLEVYAYAKTIMKNMFVNDKVIEMVMFSSLLHDTVDHKYKNDNREKLIEFLEKNTKLNKEIIWIIDHISYSKELKNGYPVNDDEDIGLARDIVSDADKITALGIMGVDRMVYYDKYINKNSNIDDSLRHVKEHSCEKLLKLSENYIRTSIGKEISQPLHDELKELVFDDDRLNKYVEKVFNN